MYQEHVTVSAISAFKDWQAKAIKSSGCQIVPLSQ